ncbi:CDP-alcohol phosphatidyltransferase family protein [Leifsonia sp. F6_8S_P_1B]|uniref:CDP-alcohol phosphatidyltransferase family protein n=1 Tax=Leifsonia williamsii TaxID=3035919 RepID=A0ABT8KA63_9MICO|nr:CDP-alcohol phosphatidyltransferase family protein [Leifsonia williamsii]MDN4613888.1 CDP-alcohol phosphatidyltransferase family protein [Leifsonia williamsii]
MQRVQLEAAGALPGALPPVGWLAMAAFLVVTAALVVRGYRRRGMARFGAANVVTSLRAVLVGAITGLVAGSFAGAVPVATVVALVVPALALDAVDGWVARRTASVTELGARFDMEVDAFLLLVLGIAVAPALGVWVLAIGLLRYAFVAAGWMLPWFRRTLPPRYWRKVVTAFAGIALAVAVSRLLPGLDVVLVGAALLLLVESFGRDAIWLVRRRREKGLDADTCFLQVSAASDRN